MIQIKYSVDTLKIKTRLRTCLSNQELEVYYATILMKNITISLLRKKHELYNYDINLEYNNKLEYAVEHR